MKPMSPSFRRLEGMDLPASSKIWCASVSHRIEALASAAVDKNKLVPVGGLEKKLEAAGTWLELQAAQGEDASLVLEKGQADEAREKVRLRSHGERILSGLDVET